MKRLSLGCASMFVVALMVSSCGDDDSGTGDAGPDGGADAATGAGSGGNGGGTGGSAMTGGSGGRQATTTPPPPPVKCGDITCPVPLKTEYNLISGFASMAGIPLPAGGAGILPTACCTTQMQCGLVVTGTGCVPPPRRDRRCPNVTILGVTAPGCCMENTGMCGANGAQTGQGCVDVSGIAALLGTPTTPTRCVEVDAGTKPDAGHPSTDDAGSEDAGH